jgi:hypothetical protein
MSTLTLERMNAAIDAAVAKSAHEFRLRLGALDARIEQVRAAVPALEREAARRRAFSDAWRACAHQN